MAKILSTVVLVYSILVCLHLYGKELKIPLHASMISLDPTAVQDQSSLWVSRQINCQLVRLTNGNIFKEAAKSIQYDGPLKIIIELKHDIQFHDGTQIKADDVIASFNYLKKSREVFRSIFQWINSIEKVSESSFVFKLKEDIPQFLDILSSPNYAIFKKSFIEKAKKNNKYWEKPLGCGSYRVSHYNSKPKSVQLTPLKEGLPIVFYFNKENQISREELNRYDIVSLQIEGESKQSTMNNAFRIEKIFDPYHIFLGLNILKKRWQNREDRCKFFANLNPQIVIDEYVDSAEYANDILPRGILGYSKHINYKKIIEEIATKSKYSFENKNEPFCLTYLSVSIPKLYRDVYTKMVTSVYQNIEIKILDDPKHFGKDFQKFDCDAIIMGLKSNTLDGYDYLLLYSEEAANIFGFQDKETIRVIKESQNIGDRSKRAYAYQKITSKIRNECLTFPILTIPMKNVYIRNNLITPEFGTVPLNEYYLGWVR